ncbi:hypothetical protein HN51_023389 [Arachis hypogaea]|uniref:uncharacterized protein n=1 Tax=Arachis hypogaea TaxID=3818 RepID=UPI000DECCCBD|nr:uncharacterized protein LOC112756611 [Arachis hypogaea]QHO26209.1 uncharacterized protein DS421_12g387570 [Arachis hypogaea]
MGRLAPLSEEPINEEEQDYYVTNSNNKNSSSSSLSKHKVFLHSWRNWNWIKNHFSIAFNKKSNLKILLSVLGCPLFPLPVHPKLPLNEVSSSAQYIIQHYSAATRCRKLEGTVKNVFTTGKVAMVVVDEVGSSGGGNGGVNNGGSEKGCFVMWQMVPDKWQIELVLSGQKVAAGSNGSVAWRHTPWLGTHAAKGGVRPLRRTLQGLDPLAISCVFSGAQYMGEKEMSEMDCFVLKLSADQKDLAQRSDNTAEMIKHSIFGYFSQRSGLLVHLEDSYLTRIQAPGSYPTYWETTMSTSIQDYRPVIVDNNNSNDNNGVMIAHAGSSTVIITRFGDNIKAGTDMTRLEESWTIDDVAFNVPGLSMDCFIPPQELQKDYPEEGLDWRSPLHR